MSHQIVGVISDTHGLFDPRIPLLFEDVQYILHAGDIGDFKVLGRLENLAPVIAVSGNVDEGNLPPGLEPEKNVLLFGVRIFMTHILGSPHRLNLGQTERIRVIQPQVVIYGHSHKPLLERVGGILYFNPGSAGPKRFSLPRTVGLLEIEEGSIHGRIVEI
jgi:putative phosphoesterase